ncbi:MAG: hypothetical protein IIX72_04260 [Oscillospiraceae bacterium]|nr:hypothetical protein [Oscillospiraceae bacterium]
MAQINLADTSRMPHACLISAADMNTAMDEARRLAAAALCEGSGKKPCGICRHCRKALAGIHPDIIHIARIVDDKGKQKKQIGVDQIRAMSADACMLPNEAARKVYIIEDADSMNPSAQNAALKLLEEPPLAAMFLLCSTNAMQLLPTVRSRCAEFNLGGKAQEKAEEKSGLAAAYIKAVAAGDSAALLRWCSQNEGMDNAAATAFAEETRQLLADMLCGREKTRGLEPAEMMHLCTLMDKCSEYLRFNVGVKHIFGLLAVESIAGSRNRG